MVTVDEQGKATVLTGSSPHGQGHQTAWTQIVADTLQIAPEDITVKHGDTAVVARGVGTFGSRSAPVGGNAVLVNSETVREKATNIASHYWKPPPRDVVLWEGKFQVQGYPERTVGWAELVQAAQSQAIPDDLQGDVSSDTDFEPKGETYPLGRMWG